MSWEKWYTRILRAELPWWMRACRRLYTCIHDSIRLAEKMKEDLLSLSTQKLMERKACYLDQMIGLLPVELFGPEAYRKRLVVHETLVNYW